MMRSVDRVSTVYRNCEIEIEWSLIKISYPCPHRKLMLFLYVIPSPRTQSLDLEIENARIHSLVSEISVSGTFLRLVLNI